jgi:two-component system chemotaxis response regulator CheB
MAAIRRTGGLTIVQDPSDALVPGMPSSVLEVMEPHAVLPAHEIGQRLAGLLAEPVAAVGDLTQMRQALRQEVAMSTLEPGAHDHEPPGTPSKFGCPECGGVLWELSENGDLRFRCRTGHAYSPRTLLAAEDAQLEDALWAALRALEEQEALARRLLDRRWAGGVSRTRDRLEQRTADARRRADILREFLLRPVGGSEMAGDDEPGHAERAPREVAAG